MLHQTFLRRWDCGFHSPWRTFCYEHGTWKFSQVALSAVFFLPPSFPLSLPPSLFPFLFWFLFYMVCGFTFSDKAVLWGSQEYLLLIAFQGHWTILLFDYSILLYFLLAWWLYSDSVKSYVSLSSKCSVQSYRVPCPLGWLTLGISLWLCRA